MTQEEKAKRYDEAIERAKEWYSNVQIGIGFKDNLEKLFPELKGSEDERIREALIALLKFGLKDGSAIAPGFNETKEQALAWLEKQGKKPQGKSALEAIREEKVDNANKIEPKDYSSIDPHFGKPIDKVEPKFKIGDWITTGDYTWKVISVDYLDYTLQNQWGECVEDTVDYVNKTFRLWTIKDAKEGNVLAFDNGTIVIFKDLYNSTSFHSYCHIEDGIFDFNKDELPDWWEGEGFKPATKEQSDILFQKIKEVGYEWDADKKELKKEEIK